MSYKLELTKANRLRLARAFRHNKRVDCSIDCVLEGQMVRAYVDDLQNPSAYRISIGPFWYFAGDASGTSAQEMMRELPAYNLLMPSPPEWTDVARAVFQNRLVSFARYSFATDQLSADHLQSLFEQSPHRDQIASLNPALIAQLQAMPEPYFEIDAFDSTADFLERGMGFAALDGDTVMGVAYASLVFSGGIEVSIFVEEKHRERGVATALGSRLLLECLSRGVRPNWDAANPESCKLAQKLGLSFVASYEAFYVSPE